MGVRAFVLKNTSLVSDTAASCLVGLEKYCPRRVHAEDTPARHPPGVFNPSAYVVRNFRVP